jgi:succinate dehydrogenase flavin-adding protein (antitoxin of CptAB toxin-antitoxin module)
MISQWSESESDTKQLSSLLGISDESLLPWTSNLATWVAEDKIDSADLIIAIEYLINQ